MSRETDILLLSLSECSPVTNNWQITQRVHLTASLRNSSAEIILPNWRMQLKTKKISGLCFRKADSVAFLPNIDIAQGGRIPKKINGRSSAGYLSARMKNVNFQCSILKLLVKMCLLFLWAINTILDFYMCIKEFVIVNFGVTCLLIVQDWIRNHILKLFFNT